MRNLKLAAIVAMSAMLAAPVQAADPIQFPVTDYPEIDTPPAVDYGLGGSFYLRGSAAMNAWSATDGTICACVTTFDNVGYGYSVGVGVGYENGEGFRTDITVDYLNNRGLTSSTGHTVNLQSAIALANVYYDFMLDDYGASAEGGMGIYVGAGVGMAKNYSEILDNAGTQVAWGKSLEAAVAVMAGVSYDMGSVVADLGYRGIYMNKVMSQPPSAPPPYIINNNFIHEVRGTVRYRL